MPSQKFVIHLSGPSCVGKSTLNQAIGEKLPGTYTVSYDTQRWQLAGYNRDRDKAMITEITLGLFEVVANKGIPIQLDFFFRKEADYRHCKDIAETYGYRFFSFELTAPTEVLLARFRERVADAKRTGSRKISVTDEKVFLENLSKDRFLPPDTQRFDTSVMSPDEIASKIVSLIK